MLVKCFVLADIPTTAIRSTMQESSQIDAAFQRQLLSVCLFVFSFKE